MRPIASEWPLLKVLRSVASQDDEWQVTAAAVIGLQRKDMAEIWMHYHCVGEAHDLKAPQREKRGVVEYSKPSEDFSSMARDAMHVMEILLSGVKFRGVEVTRYDWEYHLLRQLGYLEMEDPNKRALAMLTCLVLSAASTDFSCIEGTASLKNNGFLNDIDQMITRPVTEISACIKKCGIHNTRAVYLKSIFTEIKEKHGGLVPGDMDSLTALHGVGRKTAILLCNEAHGFFRGIGTDKHVCNVSEAIGIFAKTHGLKNAAPIHVEMSLRTWIAQAQFKETNRTFGSMAQLFTQVLGNVQANPEKFRERANPEKLVDVEKEDEDNEEDIENLRRLGLSMVDRFHCAYEIELIWFIIGKIRRHYKKVAEKRATKKEAGDEESDDEAVEEEERNPQDMDEENEFWGSVEVNNE